MKNTPLAQIYEKQVLSEGVGDWIRGAARTAGEFAGGVARGMARDVVGSPGSTPSGGQASTPQQKPITKQVSGELSGYPANKPTATTLANAVTEFGLTSQEAKAVEKGTILNVMDSKGNIIQFRFENGLLTGTRIKGKSQSAPQAQPAPVQPAPAQPVVQPSPAPQAQPVAPRGSSAPRHPRTGRFFKPKKGAPGGQPPLLKNFGKRPVKEATFDETYQKTIKDFYKN